MDSKGDDFEVRTELNARVWSGIKTNVVLFFMAATFAWYLLKNTAGVGFGVHIWYTKSVILSLGIFLIASYFKPKSRRSSEAIITTIIIMINLMWVYPVYTGAQFINSNVSLLLLPPLVLFTLGTAAIISPLCYQAIGSVLLALLPAIFIYNSIENLQAVSQLFLAGGVAAWAVRVRYKSVLSQIVNNRNTGLRAQKLYSQYNKLKKYIKHQNNGRWRWDLKNNKLHFSNTWIRMFGWPEGANGDSDIIWESLVHPEDFHAIYRFWSVFQSGEKETFEIEHRLKTIEGYKWVLIKGIATDYDEKGNVIEIYGSHTDIDDTKRKEIESKRFTKLSITLMKVRSIITYYDNENDILTNICDLLVNEADFKYAWVSRVINSSKSRSEEPSLVPIVSAGISKGSLVKCLEDNKLFPDIECRAPIQCAMTGRTHYRKSARNIVKKVAYEDPERSDAVFIPLVLGNDDTVVLSFQMIENQFLGGPEIRMIEELGDDLTYALINLRNRKKMEKVQTELRDERNLFTSGPVAAIKWVPFPDVEVKYVSPNISQFGYSAEDLIKGKIEINSIVHPEDTDYFWSEIRKKYSNEKDFGFEMTFRIIDASGDTRFVRLYNRIITSPEGMSSGRYFYGYILDISNLISMENYLRISEKRYNILVENSNDAIVFIEDGKILYINPAGSRVTGYSPDEIVGSKIVYWIDRKNRAEVLKDLKKLNRGIWNSSLTNLMIKTKNGPKPVEVSTARYIDNDRISFIAFVRDVTSRQEIENALKSKIEELELFNNVAVSREIRMIELKRQINRLMGRKKPYKIAE